MSKLVPQRVVLETLLRIAIASLIAFFATRGEDLLHFLTSSFTGRREEGRETKEDGVSGMVEKDLSSFPSLKEVGGHSLVKEDLLSLVVRPLSHPLLFYGKEVPPSLRPPRGVLLHGPPGTGKTLLARATAREAGSSFLSLTASGLESKWWGDTPKLLRSCFEAAKGPLSPCVLFMDEVDGMGKARGEGDQQCVYSFKCELLRCMDSLDGSSPVSVIACTNCPSSLDPALRRRFGKECLVPPPSTTLEREEILRSLVGREEKVEEGSLRKVASRTEGRTGSDLASLFQAASSKRLRGEKMKEALLSHDVKTGSDLSLLLGPLLFSHWSEAAEEAGVPFLPDKK